MVCMVSYRLFPLATLLFQVLGVDAVTLTSSPVEPLHGWVSVCPHTNITFTCAASQISALTWFARPLLDEDNTPGLSLLTGTGFSVTIDNVLTITVVSIENITNNLGDFTTTLHIVVNERIQNETNITCRTELGTASLIILKKGLPLRPSGVNVETRDFKTDNYSVFISWEEVQRADYYIYTITVNVTSVNITMNSSAITTIAAISFEAMYNNFIEVSIEASNCAGSSETVTTDVYEAGCSPPSPPVNGSVSEFTSSRVGAQVTYSCDTDLVLVGERVATCSEPSLQWLPSSEDIMCVHPPGTSMSSTVASSRPSVAVIVAPVLIVVVLGAALIVLVIVLCTHRTNRRKKPQTTNNHALLSRPDSRASTTANSTAPSLSQSPIVGTYDLVRPVETTLSYKFGKSAETSLSGTSPTPLYSEANNAMRTFELPPPRAISTSHQTTEPATGPTHKIQRQQYTDVSIENQVLPPPHIDPTGEPCKYATLDLSSLVPPDHNSTTPAENPEKHPLDKAINFDQVIQQLQPLIPYWLTLGETARLHSKQLADISQHCQGDDHQSLIEMMSRIYVPGQTTWSGIAELCRAARFANIADSLMNAYNTGVLPIQVEDDVPVSVSPNGPPPALPPRGINDNEDGEDAVPPALPPPLAPGDIPPPENDNVLPLPPRNKGTAPVKPPRLPPKH